MTTAPARTGSNAAVLDLRTDLLVADSQRLFAEVLSLRLWTLPGVVEVRPAWSLPQARALAARRAPDVVLLDPALDGGAGLELLAVLRDLSPRPVVVVVTDIDDPAVMVRGLSLGVRGWVSKEASLHELWLAVGRARAGSLHVPTTAWHSLTLELLAERQRLRTQRELTRLLSSRQHQVLDCLLAGMTRAEVAATLMMSVHTVRTHVRELLRLLEVSSSPQLVARARAAGLGEPALSRSPVETEVPAQRARLPRTPDRLAGHSPP